MALDRSWIQVIDRTKIEYQEGIDAFLEFAYLNVGEMDKIRCPCIRCRNVEYKDKDEVRYHLLKYGIMQNYTIWYCHGEKYGQENTRATIETDQYDDMVGLVHDVYGMNDAFIGDNGNSNGIPSEEEPHGESATFYNLLHEAKKKLFPGCDHSKLGVIVKLLHLKSYHRWTNKSFDALLELLQEIIPDGKATLPNSFYNAQKYVSELGLDYIKYDVCKNNCVVYWDDNANAQSCPVCGLSRWKVVKRSDGGKNIPHKVLRYFPIKKRLQRLFTSTKTASDMRWHKEKIIDDGVMRHPADSNAWKSFDIQHPEFAHDARNVRLGLATDGFQPFGNMSSQHSIWPVVLMPYNLPPWRCMKQPYFMMSVLIPGPHSPGMGIDVFLAPLIKDLKDLWENGIETYDAHARQNFIMYAAVLWTVNDFSAYGDLSGWSTKGYLACPTCHKDTTSNRLRGSRKLCYMGHRRFLPMGHKWCKNAMAFDGTIEKRARPIPLSGAEVLSEVQTFNQAPFGRGQKRKYDSSNSYYNWRKKSIFFELPYWSSLSIRHNLDVMHIEKNVCDNVLGTIMNIKGKTKDTLGSRYDLVSMGIRPELHPKLVGNLVHMSVARYTLSNDEKIALCNMLLGLKTPDGFLSNITRCVNKKERKISGMKSHDYHVFMQRLLPMVVRSLLPKEVCKPLVELSAFFRDLCRKSLNINDLDHLQHNIILTLCKMEMIFPPSFFDVMVHLIVHLAEEAKISGPVQYRWMYPIERYLRTLKSYVRNKARPEGSIAEAYIVDECLTFCSRYIEGVDTKFNCPPRYADIQKPNNDENGFLIFQCTGSPLGNAIYKEITHDMLRKAQIYVLNNCPEVLPYIEQYKSTMPNVSQYQLLKRYNFEFKDWLHHHIVKLHKQGLASDDLLCLAFGPTLTVKQYHGFDISGYRFRTYARDQSRRTQSSGILCRGDDSSNDKEYYGVLEEIWELQYAHSNIVHLFKCQWFDVQNDGSGYRVDNYGITTVNQNRRLQTDEPFILACQAEQVFYVPDLNDPNWLVVMKVQPRDLYCMPHAPIENITEDCCPTNDEAYQADEEDMYGRLTRPLDEGDDIELLNRVDIDGETETVEVAKEVERRINIDAACNNDFIDDSEINENDNEYSSESECGADMSDD